MGDARTTGRTRAGRLAAAASLALVGLTALQPAAPALAQERISFIRDAEIEGLMRRYLKPIFEVAGIHEDAVEVHLIADSRINAFVAGGQRIFIHTGLLRQAKTPNQVIGVLAHETGHIAGGHLARMGIQADKLSTLAIATALAGAAATIGAGMAGQRDAGKAGVAAMVAGPSMAHRLLLNYVRAQEASADQAAMKYLDATGQSGKGMLELFHTLYNQTIASLEYVNPYAMSHPLPLDRIRNLERLVKASRHYDAPDSDVLVLRHAMAQAKLVGFMSPLQQVFRDYPPADRSLPARYARAIATFRSGDTRNAVPLIDELIAEVPKNPYFWELKGQALLEGGWPADAVAPLRKAVELYPESGLIAILLAQAHLGVGGADNARAALRLLERARKREVNSPGYHLMMARAYGQTGEIGLADLATAEAALLNEDKKLAKERAKAAAARLKHGSPSWLKANDILTSIKDDG